MLPARGRRGWGVYAAGMEASAPDKAKLLKWVKPGVVADLGCGTGTVLALLKRKFPRGQFVGVDLSEEMVAHCRRRFPGLEIRRHDITVRLFDEESIDTIVLCSVLHEVFSYKGYDLSAVRETLGHCAEALKRGGRLLLRDGVKPEREDSVYLTFLNEPAKLKFFRFAKEFGSSEVVWREVDGRVHVARRDAMEFLTKYIYDVNWVHEVKEHFGVLPLQGWVDEVKRLGLKPFFYDSYTIPWLRDTHWRRDVRLEVKVEDRYRPTEYPHTTFVLAGQK
jgi:SAM-dependent methyltransferase